MEAIGGIIEIIHIESFVVNHTILILEKGQHGVLVVDQKLRLSLCITFILFILWQGNDFKYIVSIRVSVTDSLRDVYVHIDKLDIEQTDACGKTKQNKYHPVIGQASSL